MEKEKIDLSGLEFCPTCGHKLKHNYTTSEKRKEASRKAGRLGGRPVNPNSNRQIALRKKAEKEQ